MAPRRKTNQRLADGSYALVSNSAGGKNLSVTQIINKAFQVAQIAHRAGKFKGNAPTKNQMLTAAVNYEIKKTNKALKKK